MILARFRADPYSIRVSLRPERGGWRATVSWRHETRALSEWHKYPTRALVLALRTAEGFGMPGLDLGMQWTYDHPWGTACPLEHRRSHD